MHFAIIPAMGRSSDRHRARLEGMRARIAAAAARIMAEDGIDDFALAKRKAARRLGAPDSEALPANDEIEAELRAYRSLYQSEEHPERIDSLRRCALEAMRLLERFNPYLTGPVLAGTAGPYAEIELQLFPESVKEVEIFLLDRDIAYSTREGRRFAAIARARSPCSRSTGKARPSGFRSSTRATSASRSRPRSRVGSSSARESAR